MQEEQSLVEKLHSETAKICWHDLQPYFAKGSLLVVDDSLDLIAVAADFAEDKVDKLKDKLEAELIAPPGNQQAAGWYAENTDLWAVVVAPFVLVQVVNNTIDNEPTED